MTPNVGTVDRVARGLLGLVLLWLAFLSGAVAGVVMWIAAIVGIVMLVTAALRVCPLYSLFGLRTCERI